MPKGVPIVITGSDKWTDIRAVLSVVHERRRQVEAEGWGEKNDDVHINGALAAAAVCYAMPAAGVLAGFSEKLWPWEKRWWKPKDRRRNLVRAAALLIAEIERLDRETTARTAAFENYIYQKPHR